MRIIMLNILNNRSIKAFFAKIDGENMTLAGDTGTGKTTAASALWEILDKHPDSITHGEKRGHIRVKLSDGETVLNCIRKNTPSASTVTITDGEGDTMPIAKFKKLISDLAVNPHKIASMRPTEQVNTLLAAADLGDVDLGKMDEGIDRAEKIRLELHRDLERMAPGEEPEKAAPVDIADLLKQKDEADETNRLILTLSEGLDGNEDLQRRGREAAHELQQKIEQIEAADAKLKKEHAEATRQLDSIEEAPTAPILEAISNAQSTNDAAAAHSQWVERQASHDQASKFHAAAIDDVKKLRDAKKDALDNAKWPIEGLTIEDGKILYKGCLLENLGESEQQLVCAAIAMKDICAHKIKVARMDGIESMSPADFQALQKLYNDAGIQVIATRVSWGGTEPDEIVIEDGVYKEEEANVCNH